MTININNVPEQATKNRPFIVARLEEGELYFWDAYYCYSNAFNEMCRLHVKGFSSILIYNQEK